MIAQCPRTLDMTRRDSQNFWMSLKRTLELSRRLEFPLNIRTDKYF